MMFPLIRAALVLGAGATFAISMTACEPETGRVRTPDEVVCTPPTKEDPEGTCRIAYDPDEDDEMETHMDPPNQRTSRGVTYVKMKDWRPAPSVQELDARRELLRLRR